MLRLILFWTLRILALIAIVINLVYLQVHGFWGVVAVIFGLLACLNLYLWGLFCRETNKKIPGLFILFRVIQGLIVFIFEGMPMRYYAVYVLVDIIFFSLLLYDSRFKFIYREPKDETNSKVRRA